MTTLLPKDSQILEIKSTFTAKSHLFPQKDIQELVETETEAQLTAPRQKVLSTDLLSRAELVSYAEGVNKVRDRMMSKYQNQLNPCISLEESLWKYIASEYPVDPEASETQAQEERQNVYNEIMDQGHFTQVAPVEFEFVRSGQEFHQMHQRQLPRKSIPSQTQKLIQRITKSKNIENAISTILNYSEAVNDENDKLNVDDNRVSLELYFEKPAVWNRDALLENPPHKLLDPALNRVAVICKDEQSKEMVQQDIIYDQAFAFQFLTFTELTRSFTKPSKFRALVQSYDIVLIDEQCMDKFRRIKLAEHPNLFSIDFTEGRAGYEKIMNSIPFKISDSKEQLKIDFGSQSWNQKELVENCRFVIEQLGYHAPWGFENIRFIYVRCQSAPQLCIYKREAKHEVTSKLFKKSQGIVPETVKNQPVTSAPKALEELPEEDDAMEDMIAEQQEEQQVSSEEEQPVVVEKKKSSKRKRKSSNKSSKRRKTKEE